MRDGLAFISSTDPTIPPPLHMGRIFIFDFNHPEENVTEVPLLGDFDRDNFRPYGISLYEDPASGEIRLFIVNPVPNDNRVEIFRFHKQKRELNHLKSVTGENVYSVNDVVAFGPESFYYTIEMFFKEVSLAKKIELYSGLPLGKIGLYDGDSTILGSGYHFPNGINLSPDGKYVYVTTSIPGELIIFKRKKDNSIEEVQRIKLHTGLDNIEVDKDTGELWIGCHPVLHLFFQHEYNDLSTLAGSQVLRLRFNFESAPYDVVDVTEVFMNDGTLMKGSSVASYYDNRMLIGTVVDKLVYCEIRTF
ncbi:serum paraoxonase/arylesterase 1-like isoform X2 [Glandiceps talaboti]